MPDRDRDRDRDHSLFYITPFFLSKVNNKVLTEIKTHLMFSTVYMGFEVTVNKKMRHIRRLLLPFSLGYNLFFSNDKSLYKMNQQCVSLNSYLSSLPINTSAKYMCILLYAEHGTKLSFVTSKKYLSNQLSLQYRQLERNFDVLEKFNIIKRRYNTSAVGDRKIGNSLHIDLTPINLLTKANDLEETEDNMTFFATFDRIEEKDIKWSGLKREARFKDIHNINGNIRQKYTWTDIEPNTENTEAIAKMDEGQDVVFKATVIRCDKLFYFKNIHNIRPREEFYNDNFMENTND